MKVKELIKILKRYKKAIILINGQEVKFEAYANHNNQFFINISTTSLKTLDQ